MSPVEWAALACSFLQPLRIPYMPTIQNREQLDQLVGDCSQTTREELAAALGLLTEPNTDAKPSRPRLQDEIATILKMRCENQSFSSIAKQIYDDTGHFFTPEGIRVRFMAALKDLTNKRAAFVV